MITAALTFRPLMSEAIHRCLLILQTKQKPVPNRGTGVIIFTLFYLSTDDQVK